MRRKRQDLPLAPLAALEAPLGLQLRLQALKTKRTLVQQEVNRCDQELREFDAFLVLEPKVSQALEILSQQVFEETLGRMEDLLSDALQSVLGTELRLRAHVTRDGRAVAQKIEFTMERAGQKEDVLRGQGGSVANILSVGMRLFALRYLNPDAHRPFLILDEPDAWVAPELVPKLMAYIQRASQELGLQVIVITHHELALVGPYADKAIILEPNPNGIVLKGEPPAYVLPDQPPLI